MPIEKYTRIILWSIVESRNLQKIPGRFQAHRYGWCRALLLPPFTTFSARNQRPSCWDFAVRCPLAGRLVLFEGRGRPWRWLDSIRIDTPPIVHIATSIEDHRKRGIIGAHGIGQSAMLVRDRSARAGWRVNTVDSRIAFNGIRAQ